MKTINSMYVKPCGESVIFDENGQKIASGKLSRPSLVSLHLQVLLALLRGEDLRWDQIERPGDGPGLSP